MKGAHWFIFAVAAISLAGCKASRQVTAPRRAAVVVPAQRASAAAATAARYPATEYYGNAWNTEHVRLSSSAASPASATLNIAGKFATPACGRINSEFGPRNGSMHTGIDIKVEANDPIYCVFDGMVRMAKTYGDYGLMVVVRHDNGLETLYAHLNSIAVKPNQRLKAGDKIGGGGRTGRASGVHLHFETRFKGEPFNPRLVIDFENCRIKATTLTLNKASYKLYGKNLQQPAPVNPRIEHIVEKGDTLYNISKRYGTTVDALRRINRLSEAATLQIGQKLVIQ
jgi:murein DD-endopeptidase MepM/ murein hydrolase activator NlpD